MIAPTGERLVRIPEVIERTSLSRSSIYRRMHRREFPQSVQIGANSVAWRASDIARWLASPLNWHPLPFGVEPGEAMPELAGLAAMAKGRTAVACSIMGQIR